MLVGCVLPFTCVIILSLWAAYFVLCTGLVVLTLICGFRVVVFVVDLFGLGFTSSYALFVYGFGWICCIAVLI